MSVPAALHPDVFRAFERILGRRITLHPHVLSLAKLALIGPIFWLMQQANAPAKAALLSACFLGFATLDYLDGVVARERNLESAAGRLLDRATDLPVLLLLTTRSDGGVTALPLALKLGLDLLLLFLFARGYGSTKNRLRTTVSYLCLFTMLMLDQGLGEPFISQTLVGRLLWLNAGISFAIVLRRLGILKRKRIADALSLANLACGMLSMTFAARGESFASLLLLALGAGLDGLDGAAARCWGGSRYGVLMDDLADAVSYGIAPGYAIYAHVLGLEGALVGAAFACFVVARLVYFTLCKSESDPNEFRGVPSTVGGLVTLSALVLLPHSALAVGFFVGLGCALMVSFDVRHRHLGRALAGREARSFALAFVVLLAVGAALGGPKLAVALVLLTSLGYGFLPSVLAFRQVLLRSKTPRTCAS